MKKIFEFKIVERKTEGNEFYRCVEANNLNEAEPMLHQKDVDFQKQYYELNVVMTLEQYEKLVKKARWHQYYLRMLFELSDTTIFDEMVNLLAQRYAITMKGLEIIVYPTLDPTFERGK